MRNTGLKASNIFNKKGYVTTDKNSPSKSSAVWRI
jgi:hypothetical protein